MPKVRRIAVTGMSVNTPLGDTPSAFLAALLAGRSAITRWRFFDDPRVYSKIGADLSDYDDAGRVSALRGRLPESLHRRLRMLSSRAPWSTRLSMLLAVDAWRDAGLVGAKSIDLTRSCSIVAGHNINDGYNFQSHVEFDEEPDFIDGLFALHSLDTDHAGSVSEVLGLSGPVYTMGGACASGNLALRAAVDEIRHHDMDVAIAVGAVLDCSPMGLHGMALMGAISHQSFNDTPARASRPYDADREGFVPAHGGAALVLESWEHARRRGAHIYAELLGVEAGGDATHLPKPSVEGQARVMRRVLQRCSVQPEEVDFVAAHATSTPLGDVTEIQSIREVFGRHAYDLRVNAIKSMIGHTCWAAPIVETVAAIEQLNAGCFHPSINIDNLDPEIDLDVCRHGAVEHPTRIIMKNSFGFGGINCVSLLRRLDSGEV